MKETCFLGFPVAQAFIKTAGKIYQKIEEGIIDVSNEVRQSRHG